MSHSEKTEVISSSKSGTSMDEGHDHCDCPNMSVPDFPQQKNRNTESLPASFNVGKALKSNLLTNIEGNINEIDLADFYNDILMNPSCDMHRGILKQLLLLHIIKASLLSSLNNKSTLQMFYDMSIKRPDLFSNKYILLYIITVVANLDYTNYSESMYV